MFFWRFFFYYVTAFAVLNRVALYTYKNYTENRFVMCIIIFIPLIKYYYHRGRRLTCEVGLYIYIYLWVTCARDDPMRFSTAVSTYRRSTVIPWLGLLLQPRSTGPSYVTMCTKRFSYVNTCINVSWSDKNGKKLIAYLLIIRRK